MVIPAVTRDRGRRPARGGRLAGGRARLGRAAVPRRRGRGGRRRVRGRAGRRGDRPALLEQGIGVRLIEPNRERARRSPRNCPALGSTWPRASTRTSSSVSGSRAQAAIFAFRDDDKNLYAATVADCTACRTGSRSPTTRLDIGLRQAGIDIAVDPRRSPPRRSCGSPTTRGPTGLDARATASRCSTSRPAPRRVRRHVAPGNADPGAVIGAIVRDGKAVFPAATRPARRRPRDRVHRSIPRLGRREVL